MSTAPAAAGRATWRSDAALFAAGFALSLIAKGVALFPLGHSVDSYPKLIAMSQNAANASGVFEEFVGQGRLGQWALNEVLAALGIVGPGGNSFYVFLTLCCFVGAGVLLCRLWRIESRPLLAFCVVGVFAIHPYHAEIFTFREATLCVGLAVVCAIGGLVLAAPRWWRWIGATLLIAFSLSLYQVAINYAIIALIVLCCLELSHSGLLRTFDWSPGSAGRRFLEEVVPRAAAIGIAVVAYFMVYKLSVLAFHGATLDARSGMLPLSHVPERVQAIVSTLRYVFAVPEPLMPGLTKVLIGAIALGAVALLAACTFTAKGVGRVLELGTLGALLAVALLTIMGVMIPLSLWGPIDRTLSAVAVLVAGVLAIAGVLGGRWLRYFALAAAFLLLLSFAGSNNVVLAEQLRVNDRDMQTATRMIGRIEANSAFPSVKSLAVIGRQREYPLHYFTVKRERGADVNVSALYRPWSKANLLREVSGYAFADASPIEREEARKYCSSAAPWPAPAAVTVLGETAVVCLAEADPSEL